MELVDVPRFAQVVISEGPQPSDGIRALAGEHVRACGIDSDGLDATGASVFVGDGNQLEPAAERYQPSEFVANDVYSRVSAEMFGSAISGAGKLMGLAAYDVGPYRNTVAAESSVDWWAGRHPLYLEHGHSKMECHSSCRRSMVLRTAAVGNREKPDRSDRKL